MSFPYVASRSAPLAISIRTIGIHAKTYFNINKRTIPCPCIKQVLEYDRTTVLFQELLRLLILDSYFVRDMGVVGAERIALTATNHFSLCRLLMTFNQIGDNRS